MNRLWKALIVECIGTFVLIFIGAGAAVMTSLGIGSLITVAFAHGFTILFLIYAYGHISGVHINPAVSVGLWVAGKFETAKLVPYIGVQLLGAIVAGFALRFVYGGPLHGLGATLVDYELTTWAGAFFLEVIGTFLMMNTILNAAVGGHAGRLAPFAVSMTVVAIILFFGPITGASLNPARTIGPAIAAGVYTDFWMYMASTLLGAVLAALFYRAVLESASPDVPPGRSAPNL